MDLFTAIWYQDLPQMQSLIATYSPAFWESYYNEQTKSDSWLDVATVAKGDALLLLCQCPYVQINVNHLFTALLHDKEAPATVSLIASRCTPECIVSLKQALEDREFGIDEKDTVRMLQRLAAYM